MGCLLAVDRRDIEARRPRSGDDRLLARQILLVSADPQIHPRGPDDRVVRLSGHRSSAPSSIAECLTRYRWSSCRLSRRSPVWASDRAWGKVADPTGVTIVAIPQAHRVGQ
jgi:hypothetical protein